MEFDPKSISLGTIPTVFTGVFNIGALDVIVKPRHLFNSLNSKSMAESKIKAVVKDEKKQKELLGVRNSHYHEIPVNEYYEELKSLEKPIAIFDAWDKTNKKAKPRIMMLLQSGKIAVMDFYSNAEVFGSNERRNYAVVTLYQKGDLEKNRQKDNKEDRDPITVTKEYIAERMSDLLHYNSSNDTEVTRVIIPNHNISSELLEDRLSQFNEKLNTYKKNRGINYSIDASTMSLDDYSSETDKDYIAADSIKYSLVKDKDLISKLDAETENPDDYIVTYRAMAKIDGKYYPPMSSKIRDDNGNWVLQDGLSKGDWVMSVERYTISGGSFKKRLSVYGFTTQTETEMFAAYVPSA